MVRFAKNGYDATSAIVRAAREFTGRDMVVHYGYHGWADWSQADRQDVPGIPEAVRALTKTFDVYDPRTLEAVLDEYGEQVALVMAALPYDRELNRDDLAAIRDLTHRHGALLAYDEIVTGFRLAPGGAQEYYGVVPDMAALGKAMSNGFPLSAWCGRRDVMMNTRPWTCSLTYGGDTLSLAAAKACLTVMREQPVHEHLWRVGAQLSEGLAKLVEKYHIPGSVVGLAPILGLNLQMDEQTGKAWDVLHATLAQHGVLHRRGHRLMVTYSHQPVDIDRALEAFDAALCAVAAAV
jgi:glutamate-1-semialdehyde aminotransferase